MTGRQINKIAEQCMVAYAPKAHPQSQRRAAQRPCSRSLQANKIKTNRPCPPVGCGHKWQIPACRATYKLRRALPLWVFAKKKIAHGSETPPVHVPTRERLKTRTGSRCGLQRLSYYYSKLLDMKFADVKNDIAFRKIFGNEKKRKCWFLF